MRPTPHGSSRSPRRLVALLGAGLALALLVGLGAVSGRAGAASVRLALAAPVGNVVASSQDSLVVKSDGTLWAWGADANGELGLGDELPRVIPTQVGGDSDWAQVSGGSSVTLALKQDGTLWAWGTDFSHQDGLGGGAVTSTPQRVGSDSDWAAISVGGDSCAALKQDGSLYTWGVSSSGALGQGAATLDVTTPTKIADSAGDSFKAISCGSDFLLAVADNGTLWACGANTDGQLGLGAGDAGSHGTLTQVGGATWQSVAAGNDTAYAIATDGSLWGWGSNRQAKLGDGTSVDRAAPVRIGASGGWTSVAASTDYACGVKSDGTLWAWGHNSYGEVGVSAVGTVITPQRIGALATWVRAAAGPDHLLALTASDTFGSCGSNSYGQTGIGYADYRTLPEQLGTAGGWRTADAGLGHAAAIRTDGTLWTWGRNARGELGLGGVGSASVNAPTQVGAATWKAVSCGDNTNAGFTLGIRSNGTLWSWGANDAGQLGLGSKGKANDRLSPTQVGTRSDWLAVAASDGVGDVGRHLWGAGDYLDFGLALNSSHQLYAWGDDSRGQLGLGDHVTRLRPVLVPCPDGVWLKVAAGDDYVVALTSNHTLYAWGDDTSAQLGLGATSAVTVPTRVGADSGWLDVACGSGRDGAHTVAIKGDPATGRGTLWAWGDNEVGQLGLGTRTPAAAPTQVGADADWVQVSCGASYGDDYTMARKADGSIWEFGGNYRGELGQGDYVQQITPVRVATEKVAAGVTPPTAVWTTMASGCNSFAIRPDGTLWGWGDNDLGQLGLGDQLSYAATPVFSILDFVDTTAPNVGATGGTTLAGASRADAGVLGATTAWAKKAVVVRFKASDPGTGAASAGVSRVECSLTGGVSWKMDGWIRVTKNGATRVLYRAVDRVGHDSLVGENLVRIDTLHPRPVASHPASVRRGAFVRLRFRVADIKAMPTCAVTLVVRNARGKVVKAVRLGQKKTNAELGYRFRCRFAKGAYRFFVSARNLAGNAQSKIASNRLTVR
jgi:alpha-tubulin suppressor-like RCC1 family protein